MGEPSALRGAAFVSFFNGRCLLRSSVWLLGEVEMEDPDGRWTLLDTVAHVSLKTNLVEPGLKCGGHHVVERQVSESAIILYASFY